MPQLSRKRLLKPAEKTLKHGKKENISKLLKPAPVTSFAKELFVLLERKRSDHVQTKTFSVSGQKENKSGKQVLSKHVSFKEENMDDASSDLAARLIMPEIKKGNLQIIQNPSHSSNSEATSLLVESQQLMENIEDVLHPDAVSKEYLTSEEHTAKNTGDSGCLFTQDTLTIKMNENVLLERKVTAVEKKKLAKNIKKINEQQNNLKHDKVFIKHKTSVEVEILKTKKSAKKLKNVTKKQNNLRHEQVPLDEKAEGESSKKKKLAKNISAVTEKQYNLKEEKYARIHKTIKTAAKEDKDNSLSQYEKMMIIQELRKVGQSATCDNARYLPHINDPVDLPEKGDCSMHPDENHNNCEVIDKDVLNYNLFNAGSIVWAKMDGFPWWPAMVQDDPDIEQYYWLEENITKPTFYHVTFFDSYDVTRAWIRPAFLKPFKINTTNPSFPISKFNKFKSRVDFAFKEATDAVNLPLLERLQKYSFIQRYYKPLKLNRVKTKVGVLNKPERKSNKLIRHVAAAEKNCNTILSLGPSTSSGDGISIVLD